MLPPSIRVIVRDWLVNTRCHSDHMGGNAAVRSARFSFDDTVAPGDES